MQAAPGRRWARVGAFLLLLLAASLPITAGGPLIVAGLGLVTVVIGLVVGLITRRFAIARAGAWMVGLSVLATTFGVFTCTLLERGDAPTAQRIIDAVERHHQATGRYPESLDA